MGINELKIDEVVNAKCVVAVAKIGRIDKVGIAPHTIASCAASIAVELVTIEFDTQEIAAEKMVGPGESHPFSGHVKAKGLKTPRISKCDGA